MAFYECIFVVKQDISPNEVHKITEKFTNLLNTQGGVHKKNEYWGLRNLAYKIKRSKKGHYVMLAFEGSLSVTQELERNFKINESIIRYMTVKVDKIEEGFSSIMGATPSATTN